MASFQIFFISTFFFVLNTASSAKICKTTYCDDLIRFPWVKFPFQLNTTSQNKRCGYRGFNLSCNRSQTILTLPHSGDFVVQGISYSEQSMNIEDPDSCFPRRFLTQNFTLSGSPFQLSETSKNYTYYNCSKEKSYEYAAPVSCLSGDNFTVLVTFNPESELQQQCQEIMYAPIDEVELSWFEPGCGVCVRGSQECALMSDDSLEVGCFDVATATPSNGILRSVKYGLTIGIGIPGLLCFIGLTCCLCNRVRLNSQSPNTQLSTSTVPQQAAFVMGLDGRIIESYPKTFLGESRELPNPNDNTCSICLSEYQPKEILRTIPECNHYFHANCIDEWLKINATCPICRNSPN
ncbi:putative RING-H2 finger protein ATL21A isoform X2 [Quercus robur]|uniref:putative RING-H2 finger protein ATL21A isoform X2 n=1 Tax=Quercus robur TaxID=38942 RepID=UPI0021630944|nr:putative RING-H2 finger protein ATL21A isoform X2 [Quercus robur]